MTNSSTITCCCGCWSSGASRWVSPACSSPNRAPNSIIYGASGTNRPSKAGSANRAGSGHGGSGESPDVRDHGVSNPNAPESDDRPDAQVGLLLSALLRDPIQKKITQHDHTNRTLRDTPRHGQSQPPSLEQPRDLVPALHRASDTVHQRTDPQVIGNQGPGNRP